MLQHRKKDYLMKLLEELTKKLYELINKKIIISNEEQEDILNECYSFFEENFNVEKDDENTVLIGKIKDVDLVEQYAKLLMADYDLSSVKQKEVLLKALDIVQYLQETDKTFSWERTVLREDILRKLDENK